MSDSFPLLANDEEAEIIIDLLSQKCPLSNIVQRLSPNLNRHGQWQECTNIPCIKRNSKGIQSQKYYIMRELCKVKRQCLGQSLFAANVRKLNNIHHRRKI